MQSNDITCMQEISKFLKNVYILPFAKDELKDANFFPSQTLTISASSGAMGLWCFYGRQQNTRN